MTLCSSSLERIAGSCSLFHEFTWVVWW